MDIENTWGSSKSMRNIRWFEVDSNELFIDTIAYCDHLMGVEYPSVVCGYNGFLEGDVVLYEGKPMTIVLVSRMGDFGLSETGKLPYSIRVYPHEVEKIRE